MPVPIEISLPTREPIVVPPVPPAPPDERSRLLADIVRLDAEARRALAERQRAEDRHRAVGRRIVEARMALRRIDGEEW